MAKITDVNAIKSWLTKQSHLPDDVDENLILRFLTVSGDSLEKTKATMDLFFCLRADAPEFFTDRDPMDPRIQEMYTHVDILPLPHLSPEGYKCFLYRLSDPAHVPDKFNFNDALKIFFMVGDARLLTETFIPKGEVIMFDMQGFTFRHLLRVILPSLRKYMVYTQEAMPVRLKQIHILNANPILDKVMMLVKPLMKGEVAKMLHFHSPGSSSFEKFIPISVLPDEYGGKAGTVNEIKECWKAKIEKNRDFYLTNPWTALNSKRTDKKHEEQVMEGSFRKLALD